MHARIALIAPLALASSVAAALAPSAARAADCSGVTSSCIDDDVLWPHAGAGRFASIGATETVTPGEIGFALVSSYLSRPLVLHVPGPGGSGGSDEYAVDDQVNGTFLWSYGVTERLELDLGVPLTFIQSGAGLSPLTGGEALKDTAVRDMRFGFAYALVPHPRTDGAPADGWGLTARFEASAPTGDDDQLAGEGTGVYAPSVSADWRRGRFFAGGEIGARLRPTVELLGARVGSQLVTALGVGVDVLPRELLAATLEAWALPDFAEQNDVSEPYPGVVLSTPNGHYVAPAEWQLGVRTAPLPGGALSIQATGGGAIPTGVGGCAAPPGAPTTGACADASFGAPVTTPRFRFTLGVRWAPVAPAGPAHPREPAAAPAAASAPAVDLHLASARDVCKSDPDVVDGFSDHDGCPDEDQDADGVPDRFDRCPLVPEDYAGLVDGCPEKR